MGGADDVQAFSFRVGGNHYKDVQAREVRVNFASKPKSISAGNKFGNSGTVVFRKARKGDGFEDTVSSRLLPQLGKPSAAIKKAIAELANEADLIDIKDADIQDCTILAKVNGRSKVIHVFDEGSFATRFPIEVPLDADGHPNAAPTWAAMIGILRTEIIARKERV